MKTLSLRLTTIGILVLALNLQSDAQVFQYDGHSTTDNLWSTATNWVGNVAPTGGATTEIHILDNVAFVGSSNQGIGTPLDLNVLSFQMPTDASHQITGSPLRFTGTAPTINVEDGPSSRAVANDLVLDANLTVAIEQDIYLSGAISGSGGILAVGNSTLDWLNLSGSSANTYAGITQVQGMDLYLNKSNNVIAVPGDIEISHGGSLRLAGDNLIAATANLMLLGGTFQQNQAQTLNSIVIDTSVASSAIYLYNAFEPLVVTGSITQTGPGFGYLGSSTGNLNGKLDLNGGTKVFDIDGGTLTIAAIVQNGGIDKQGSGTLSLSNTNTYTGGTTVTAGRLRGNTNALIGNIPNSGVIEFAQSSSDTYSGVISGTGSFEKTNGGTLTLGAAQTYTGSTTVSQGSLAIGGNEFIADSSDLIVSNSGTFDVATFNETVGTVTISSGSIIGSGVLNGSSYDAQGGTVSVALAGTGTLTKTTNATSTLSGNNTYQGGTFVNQGTLVLSGDERLADTGSVEVSSGTLQVTGTETVGAVTFNSGTINGNGKLIASSFAVQSGSAQVELSGSGALTKTGTGSFIVSNSATYSGGTFVNAGTLQLSGSERLPDAGAVEINGGNLIVSGSESIGALTLIDGNVSSGTLNATSLDVRKGIITSRLTGTAALTKSTSDTVTLRGFSNNYSGGTTVNAGILAGYTSALQGTIVNNATVRFESSSGTFNGVISGTGNVEINTGVAYSAVNTYTGGTTITSGYLYTDSSYVPGDVAMSNGTLYFNDSGAGAFANAITGTGVVYLQGTGEVTLSGNNTFSGVTYLTQGGLAIGSNSAIDGGSTLVMYPGATIRAEGATRTLASPLDISFGGSPHTFGGSEDLTFIDTTPISLQFDHQLISTNSATTTIDAAISAPLGSVIHASAGNFVLGNPNSFLGFQSLGTLLIDSGATLTLRSAGYVDLGALTPLAGGTLATVNGVSLGASENIVGNGTVSGPVAAQIGSVIAATTGNLTLGDSTAVAGFYSDGELRTRQHTVTINDANEAVLGSLTTLGDGASGGTLVAGAATVGDTAPHFLVEQGKNVTGRGTIEGNFKNNGHVIGDGTATGERIAFGSDWTVSGIGTFENTLVLGTFAPGLSPAIVAGENFSFAGMVEMELGGTTPGSGSNNHDQIIDAATMELLSGVDLELKPWHGFQPQVGDSFKLLLSDQNLLGTFDEVMVDPYFQALGIDFDLHYTANSLTAVAVAAGLAADFDADGDVDGRDFLIWQRNPTLGGLDDWHANFGDVAPLWASTSAIPEPNSLLLATLACSMCFLRRRANH
ncbi:beta strand repeat-containing protein [Bythopirellula goksoeyrii]|uniref:Autotransporter-associated beta strand repeat protein n=1 Tax=Bythopirellula goksoeyrii TaxID=1400387 RepID=A0A5B9Q271_9BACT|nr:autotransporter-associated beta strand repeat-containing protein [Bythopirellula goksoeyrii]QEG33074.1 Autotransporter-associated beta strand repeat protein [Bythopirellula goksoeyrii]